MADGGWRTVYPGADAQVRAWLLGVHVDVLPGQQFIVGVSLTVHPSRMCRAAAAAYKSHPQTAAPAAYIRVCAGGGRGGGGHGTTFQGPSSLSAAASSCGTSPPAARQRRQAEAEGTK